MRSLIALTVTAPMALLAACGEATPADEVEPAPMETAALEAAKPEPMASPPADALDSVDYSGTYTKPSENGSIERLTLNAEDDSYEYTAGDGRTSSGTYTRMDDNRRIMIEDFGGRAGYFTVADGAVYRLPEADSSPDEITVTGMYRREGQGVQSVAPDASTNSVPDKRD
ncbi:hypothetical protein FHS61_001218 [Altererythrobacter atlanticus]|uniref:Uncharacterized protein n=1 Tax=Croceibacterium atlanticum TaxID=1267766 RepID=A0A0F7KV18_9SPHN|nr:hypothetical protein [Croceibacterium atlanticum]AKH43082.1 hypothetical protein WYH_02048 [Croceibacterium atlanticum]MBB5732214.1 hypothetical protein [Croceibacterium atlanticum]